MKTSKSRAELYQANFQKRYGYGSTITYKDVVCAFGASAFLVWLWFNYCL